VRRSAIYPADNKTPRSMYRGVGIISCAIQPLPGWVVGPG
jgi:hypothetical protein